MRFSSTLVSSLRVGQRNNTTIGRAFDEKSAKKWLQFVCTHEHCEQKTQADRLVQKTISKLAYDKGVVLVKCKCEKLHLIADRLGWMEDDAVDIEKIAARKGMKVQTGVLEYEPQKDAEQK